MTTFFLAVPLLLVLAEAVTASGYKPDAICSSNQGLKETDPLVYYEIIRPSDQTQDVKAKANAAQQKTPERKGRVIVGKRMVELSNQYGTPPPAHWKLHCREVPVIFIVSCDPKPAFHYCIPVCPGKNDNNHVEAAVEALKTSAKTEANRNAEKQPDGKMNWSCNGEQYQILCQDVGDTKVSSVSTTEAKCKA